MTRLEFKDLVLWGTTHSQAAAASNMLHQTMAAATNIAYQTAWRSPMSDAYRGRDYTIPTVIGQTEYALPAEIQEFTPPCRCAGYPLAEIERKGDFYGLAARFGTDADATGTPMFYLLHTENPASSNADAILLTLWLYPTPDAVRTVSYAGNVKAPHYTACDLEDAVGVMHCPDDYVELIILPLTKEAMMATSGFYRADIAAAITKEADRARERLGQIEPSAAKREVAA